MARISNERESFSHRLRQALRNAHHCSDSPTALARDFNLRFAGPPITAHAARKWLVGEAIPTQEKMRALAAWLLVPVDWLRFGGEETHAGAQVDTSHFSQEDLKLVSELQLLDNRERQIVREFIRILMRTARTAHAKPDADNSAAL